MLGHRGVTIGGWGRVVEGRAGTTMDRATTTRRRVSARANERCRVASRGFVERTSSRREGSSRSSTHRIELESRFERVDRETI